MPHSAGNGRRGSGCNGSYRRAVRQAAVSFAYTGIFLFTKHSSLTEFVSRGGRQPSLGRSLVKVVPSPFSRPCRTPSALRADGFKAVGEKSTHGVPFLGGENSASGSSSASSLRVIFAFIGSLRSYSTISRAAQLYVLLLPAVWANPDRKKPGKLPVFFCAPLVRRVRHLELPFVAIVRTRSERSRRLRKKLPDSVTSTLRPARRRNLALNI